MKYITFSYQPEFLQGAYTRLKEWFDPSFEGSPYEANSPLSQPHVKKGPFLLKKRIFFRF
jgi:hypothetical protein